MRERAELIGASYRVTSRPGHGTEVAVSLPLRRSDP
jgi:two-component system sensor histidine kinase DegS